MKSTVELLLFLKVFISEQYGRIHTCELFRLSSTDYSKMQIKTTNRRFIGATHLQLFMRSATL